MRRLLRLLGSDFERVFDNYYEEPKRKRGSTHKEYPNKNANIEYYTDEYGNIRRRKKHG